MSCRHCNKPTGTYRDKMTGQTKNYVACPECKDLPPPGMLPCSVSFGLDKPCANFMPAKMKCCYTCRNRTVCINCEKCGTQFWDLAWKSVCKNCFISQLKPQATLADLLSKTS